MQKAGAEVETGETASGTADVTAAALEAGETASGTAAAAEGSVLAAETGTGTAAAVGVDAAVVPAENAAEAGTRGTRGGTAEGRANGTAAGPRTGETAGEDPKLIRRFVTVHAVPVDLKSVVGSITDSSVSISTRVCT